MYAWIDVKCKTRLFKHLTCPFICYCIGISCNCNGIYIWSRSHTKMTSIWLAGWLNFPYLRRYAIKWQFYWKKWNDYIGITWRTRWYGFHCPFICICNQVNRTHHLKCYVDLFVLCIHYRWATDRLDHKLSIVFFFSFFWYCTVLFSTALFRIRNETYENQIKMCLKGIKSTYK